MNTLEARRIVQDRITELERDLSQAKGFAEKRNILQGLSASREMILYLDLIEAGDNPRFRKIEAEIAFPNSEVFA